MINIIFVIAGGALGALLRYISSQIINNFFNGKFTLGTIFVNCAGSLLIGFLMNVFDIFGLEQKWKLLVITGFLGAYTTFSTYSFETVNYFIQGSIKYAVINILVNNILCLFFAALGIWLNKIVFK